jgi:hypothetical protein
MIDKIFVFGDSFMYGEESHQHEFEQQQFLKDASSAVGRTIVLDINGVPTKPFSSKEMAKYITFINDAIPESKHPNYWSIGCILGRQFNVPVEVHAFSGNSNNIIYKTFLDCLSSMTEHSLIIFGISQPNRKSYYEEWIDNRPVNQITSCWSDVNEKPGWSKYEELDTMFGDDATAHVLHTYSIVTSAKAVCPGQILFIDPFHQFCDNKYHPDIPWNYIKSQSMDSKKYKHQSLLKYLEKQFKDIFCYGISEVFDEVTNDGNHIQCINGHYSKYTYEKYIDRVLMKYLENSNANS